MHDATGATPATSSPPDTTEQSFVASEPAAPAANANVASPPRKHVMIDLETLGTGLECQILSIGAVKFDPLSWDLSEAETFYLQIDTETAEQYGRKIDAGTVKWWFHPDRDAPRAKLFEQRERTVDYLSALEGFAMWYGPESLPTWSNAVTFDVMILNNCYDALKAPRPWKFWDERCYRTVKSMVEHIKIVRIGEHHHALGDALSQAHHLQRIWSALGFRK